MSGIRIGGLWEKKTPQGEIYYEGNWGNAIIRVYSNRYIKSDKDPAVVLFLSEKPKEQRPGIPAKTPFNRPRVSPNPEKGTVKKAVQNSAPNATRREYVDHTESPQDEPPWPEHENDSDSEMNF